MSSQMQNVDNRRKIMFGGVFTSAWRSINNHHHRSGIIIWPGYISAWQ